MILVNILKFLVVSIIMSVSLTFCNEYLAPHSKKESYEFRIFSQNHKWDLIIKKSDSIFYILAINPTDAGKYDLSFDGNVTLNGRNIGQLESSTPYFAAQSMVHKLCDDIDTEKFLIDVDYGHQANIRAKDYRFVDQLLLIDHEKSENKKIRSFP